MSQVGSVVDILILGNTLTGICLANLLKGKLGNTFKILVLDVAGDEGIYQDQARYASLDNDAVPDEPNMARKKIIQAKAKRNITTVSKNTSGYDQDNYLKKIFVDENMNLIDAEYSNVFPYGDVYQSKKIKIWFNEINTLSKFVPPTGVSIESTLVKELDNISVREHMHQYVNSSRERKAIEEMVWELSGVPANKVSMLFFLWIRKRSRMSLRNKKVFKDSVSYTVTAIRQQDENKVFVETDKGMFLCSMVAMAVKPSQIRDMKIEKELLRSTKDLEIISRMFHGERRGFTVDYLTPFWKEKGYSGEIFSLSGAIRSTTDETINFLNDNGFIKVYTICGHLRVDVNQENVNEIDKYKSGVTEQLALCFGQEAITPIHYIEEKYDFIEIPQIGDFTELMKMISLSEETKLIEWSCLDIYNNCDIDSALLAAQKACINIIYTLRPQVISYEDLTSFSPKIKLPEFDLLEAIKKFLLRSLNYKTASVVLVTSAVYIFLKYFYYGT